MSVRTRSVQWRSSLLSEGARTSDFGGHVPLARDRPLISPIFCGATMSGSGGARAGGGLASDNERVINCQRLCGLCPALTGDVDERRRLVLLAAVHGRVPDRPRDPRREPLGPSGSVLIGPPGAWS